MKKLLALVLCVLLVCTVFFGCTNTAPAPESGLPGERDHGERNPGEIAQGDVSEEYPPQNDPTQDYSARPLRLFVDFYAGFIGAVSYRTDDDMVEDILNMVAERGGPTDIEVEMMPPQPDARQTELNRLRVELMAGGGPDVFLTTSVEPIYSGQDQALFQFPEQAMRRGFFLKLDEYIENAQFMEWEKLNPVVMDAGRTEEGQYLLPIVYSFPMAFFLADDVDPYPVTTTWSDIAAGNDPVLNTLMEPQYDSEGRKDWCGTSYLSLTWKNLADYDSGELLISEEDLLQRAKEALAVGEKGTTELRHFSSTMSRELFSPSSQWLTFDVERYQGITPTDPVTMIPLYCDQGGAVVPVRAYTGINAATERPEDAFFVTDVLLSEDFQGKSFLFDAWEGRSIPVCDELTGVMLAPILEAYLEARSQITSARIATPLDAKINGAMLEYQWMLEDGEATEEALEKLISDAYREMKQMLDES